MKKELKKMKYKKVEKLVREILNTKNASLSKDGLSISIERDTRGFMTSRRNNCHFVIEGIIIYDEE